MGWKKKCPKDHKCKRNKENEYPCTICGRKLVWGAKHMYRCTPCKHNICFDCASPINSKTYGRFRMEREQWLKYLESNELIPAAAEINMTEGEMNRLKRYCQLHGMNRRRLQRLCRETAKRSLIKDD